MQCDGAGNTAALAAWRASNGGVVIADCSAYVMSTKYNSTPLATGCDGTGAAVLTVTAVDMCGNTASVSGVFSIVVRCHLSMLLTVSTGCCFFFYLYLAPYSQDRVAPAITAAAQSTTVQCDGLGNTAALQAFLASRAGTQAQDVCSSVAWSNNYTAPSPTCGHARRAAVAFSATDGCMNTNSSVAVFTIEVWNLSLSLPLLSMDLISSL